MRFKNWHHFHLHGAHNRIMKPSPLKNLHAPFLSVNLSITGIFVNFITRHLFVSISHVECQTKICIGYLQERHQTWIDLVITKIFSSIHPTIH